MNNKFRVWNKRANKYSYERWAITSKGKLSWLSKYNKLSEIGFDRDNFIVEWCTGLKDKNDVEIYEGDIVKYDIEFEIFDGYYDQHGLKGFIKYNEESCGYEVFENDDNYSLSTLKNLEIIGNIHEGGKNE